MRQGRKSRARVINGYKAHIAMDAESELVVGVEATRPMFMTAKRRDVLSSEPEELKTKKIIGDAAYGTAKLRQECKEENIEVMAPVPSPDVGPFGKQNFEIDIEAQTCICPGGQQGRPVKNKRGELRAFTLAPRNVAPVFSRSSA